MMVDTRIYGYYDGDATLVCASCADVEPRYCPKHGMEYHDNRGDVWSPVYSHVDDGRGLVCDTCTEFIFEPDEDYCLDHDDWHEEPCERQNIDKQNLMFLYSARKKEV